MSRQRWIVVGCLVASLVLHLRFLSEPLERDEGAYAYVAARMLEGAVPYRDVFDHKPPGVHVAYALAFLALGPTALAVRLAGAVAGVAATWAAVRAARLVWGAHAEAPTALLATPLLALPQVHATMANTEIFLAVPAALHIGLTWRARERNSPWTAAGAGVLAGLAVLFKPVAAVNLVAAVVFEAVAGGPGRGRRALAQALGFAVPLALTLAVFAGLGARADLVRDVIDYNRAYAAGPRAPLVRLFIPCLTTLAFWSLLALAGAAAALRDERRAQGVLATLWLLGSLAGVAAAGRLYPHYYIQLLPPLALLAAAGWRVLAAGRPGLLLAALVGSICLAREARWFARSPDDASRAKYGSGFVDAAAIARVLARHVPAGATTLVWGSEPEVYFYSGTRAPGRFAYFPDGRFEEAADDMLGLPIPEAIVLTAGAAGDPRLPALLAGFVLVTGRGTMELWLPRESAPVQTTRWPAADAR